MTIPSPCRRAGGTRTARPARSSCERRSGPASTTSPPPFAVRWWPDRPTRLRREVGVILFLGGAVLLVFAMLTRQPAGESERAGDQRDGPRPPANPPASAPRSRGRGFRAIRVRSRSLGADRPPGRGASAKPREPSPSPSPSPTPAPSATPDPDVDAPSRRPPRTRHRTLVPTPRPTPRPTPTPTPHPDAQADPAVPTPNPRPDALAQPEHRPPTPTPTPTAPFIESFVASLTVGSAPLSVTFDWHCRSTTTSGRSTSATATRPAVWLHPPRRTASASGTFRASARRCRALPALTASADRPSTSSRDAVPPRGAPHSRSRLLAASLAVPRIDLCRGSRRWRPACPTREGMSRRSSPSSGSDAEDGDTDGVRGCRTPATPSGASARGSVRRTVTAMSRRPARSTYQYTPWSRTPTG